MILLLLSLFRFKPAKVIKNSSPGTPRVLFRTNAFCSWGMRCGYVRVKWKRLILPKQRMFPINCSAISGK